MKNRAVAPLLTALVAALVCSLATACTATKHNTKGVRITLSMVDGKHSKDSHSSNYTVSLEGEKVSYHVPIRRVSAVGACIRQ